MSSSRGATRCRHPTNGRAIRRSPAGPLDLTRSAPVEAACSRLPAVFQKENTLLTDSVSFVTGCRFCCPHPYTSQGRESVRGEPLTGSPTRVQSPARRQPLLHSKSAASKKKRHTNVCLFFFGAGDEARTRYLDLGKVALYQMSYARKRKVDCSRKHAACQPCIFIFCKNAAVAARATA